VQAAYFAYGSNMSSARLQARIPEATTRGPGRLVDWQLRLDKPSRDGSAKANIAPQTGSLVWGVLWTIPESAWPELDRYEPGYERTRCRIVDAEGRPASSFTFTYVYPGPACELAPFDWYVDHLVTGAREHGLPDTWQRRLTALRVAARPEPEPDQE